MTPWWSEQDAALIGSIGGTLLGILGGIGGMLCGIYAPRGKYKQGVLGFLIVMIAIGLVSLLAGLAAIAIGQPYAVWYGLVLTGLVLSCVIGGIFPMVRRRYREAEGRRLDAEGLRKS